MGLVPGARSALLGSTAVAPSGGGAGAGGLAEEGQTLYAINPSAMTRIATAPISLT
jgi:hypothetical protein